MEKFKPEDSHWGQSRCESLTQTLSLTQSLRPTEIKNHCIQRIHNSSGNEKSITARFIMSFAFTFIWPAMRFPEKLKTNLFAWPSLIVTNCKNGSDFSFLRQITFSSSPARAFIESLTQGLFTQEFLI